MAGVNETDFHHLISGEARGFLPALQRAGLRGASVFYGAGVRVRNLAFDLGLRRVHQMPVPVVSVGNITTGGTGKTPFVGFLARWFGQRGVRVALVSRGYRALPGTANDEKLLLERLLPDVPHVQNPDRVAAARQAVHEHGAGLLILDDGFQHRRLARDLDIVLIDCLNPWGYGRLLPRGLLREPLSALRRADLVVLTRSDQCPPARRRRIMEQVRQARTADVSDEAACVEVAWPPECLVNADGETAPLSILADRRVAAFCGIGNPPAFLQTLADLGCLVEVWRPFPDHHHYTSEELADLARAAREHDAAALVATQKDLVKINRPDVEGIPLWAVQLGIRIGRGGERLEERLAARLLSVAQRSSNSS